MLTRNRQLDVAVIEQPSAQQPRFDTEVFPAERVLDRDFPQTRGAEEELVLRVVELFARGWREPFGLASRPQQELRVEQELHSSRPNRAAVSPLSLIHISEPT